MCQILFCFIVFKQVVLSVCNSLSLKLILFLSKQPSFFGAIYIFFFLEKAILDLAVTHIFMNFPVSY